MDCCLRITPFLLILAISGAFSASLPSGPQPQALIEPQLKTEETAKSAFVLDIRIVNRMFTDALLDQNSQTYKDLRTDVTEVLHKVYACNLCPTKDSYLGVSDMIFRNGSVMVYSMLLFDTTEINTEVIEGLLKTSLANQEIAGLEIDKNFIAGSEVSVPISQPSTPSQVPPTHTTHLAQSTTAHFSSTSVSKFTTVSSKSTTSLPLSHVTNRTKDSNTTLSIYSSGSVTTATRHTGSETSMSVSTPLKSTAVFTNNTASLPVITRTSVSTATTPRNDTSKKSSPPLRYTTKGPAGKATSGSHNGSMSTSTRPSVNYSTTTRRTSTDSHRMTTISSSTGGGVPGWAIALLVLACVILVLVIVVLILVLWRWCCHREEPGFVYVSGEPKPHGKPKQVSLGPDVFAKEPSVKNLDDAEKPKRSRSGFYVVNPE